MKSSKGLSPRRTVVLTLNLCSPLQLLRCFLSFTQVEAFKLTGVALAVLAPVLYIFSSL